MPRNVSRLAGLADRVSFHTLRRFLLGMVSLYSVLLLGYSLRRSPAERSIRDTFSRSCFSLAFMTSVIPAYSTLSVPKFPPNNLAPAEKARRRPIAMTRFPPKDAPTLRAVIIGYLPINNGLFE